MPTVRNLHEAVRILRAIRASLRRWMTARIARVRGVEMAKLNDVADYILLVADASGEPVTNLKLQKLVYYAQAWSLALRDTLLFDEKIKAWVHGPVVPQLYHRFKDYGVNLIPKNGDRIPELTAGEQSLLDDVLDVYLGFSSWDLERLTHEEEPWIEARRGLSPDEPSDREISPATMTTFYRKRSEEANAG
jgi:uncharacterized phage-associated protein